MNIIFEKFAHIFRFLSTFRTNIHVSKNIEPPRDYITLLDGKIKEKFNFFLNNQTKIEYCLYLALSVDGKMFKSHLQKFLHDGYKALLY